MENKINVISNILVKEASNIIAVPEVPSDNTVVNVDTTSSFLLK